MGFDWSRWKISLRFFNYYYRLRTFEWKIVMGFATFVWKIAVKFVSLYFHLASDVGRRWLGHALSEISRRSMAAFEVNVPSARSDPTRNKHKDHVVPAGYGIICTIFRLFLVLRLHFPAERSSSSCSCHYSIRPHLGDPSRHPNTFSLTLPRKKGNLDYPNEFL